MRWAECLCGGKGRCFARRIRVGIWNPAEFERDGLTWMASVMGGFCGVVGFLNPSLPARLALGFVVLVGI